MCWNGDGPHKLSHVFKSQTELKELKAHFDPKRREMKNFDRNNPSLASSSQNDDYSSEKKSEEDVLAFLENHFDDGGNNMFCCGNMMDCIDENYDGLSYKSNQYEKDHYLQLAHATGSDRLIYATQHMLQQSVDDKEDGRNNQSYNDMFAGLLVREFEGIMNATIYDGLRFGWNQHDNPADDKLANGDATFVDVKNAASSEDGGLI